jgi:NADH-quinone oxidoreductase subunit A
MDFEISTYYPIFLFLVVVLGFSLTTIFLAHVIGPRKKTPVKEMPYESGMDPIGTARQKFDVKFYLVAIMFLVFDVELLFLYPWAVSAYTLFDGDLKRLQGPIFVGVLVFLALLLLGYLYDWRKGVFRWR